MVEKKEKRLGRGLDFFLSDSPAPSLGEEVQQLEINSLVPSPYQPRVEFPEEELEDLARSIRASGVLQPILVRRAGAQHQIIAGERRWRAAKQAGLERIPALVREVTDHAAAVYGLVENLQRSDLNAIEKAKAFQRIRALTQGTQEEVARQVGLNRSTVTNFLRLLDLPEAVQQHVSRGTLSMGHARALLGLEDPEEQSRLCDEILRRRLSVRQIEALVQDLQGTTRPQAEGATSTPKKPQSRQKEPWLLEIEETLSEALRSPVQIRYSPKRSWITIECLGRPEFERLYEQLKESPSD